MSCPVVLSISKKHVYVAAKMSKKKENSRVSAYLMASAVFGIELVAIDRGRHLDRVFFCGLSNLAYSC